MAIWDYREYRRDPFAFTDPRTTLVNCQVAPFREEYIKERRSETFLNVCPYCAILLSDVHASHRYFDWDGKEIGDASRSVLQTDKRIAICEDCGWHSAVVVHQHQGLSEYDYKLLGASASLREFSLVNLSEPLDEVRSYLRLKYESRFTMSPKLFENVVASVFRELGYSAVVTGHMNDEGIDIVLVNGDILAGVQVKRYKDSIEAEQIRSLAGAMKLRGLTRGIFVTTSQYRSGAKTTAERFKYIGEPIELVDGTQFLEMLEITKRPVSLPSTESEITKIFDKVRPLVSFHNFSGHGVPHLGFQEFDSVFSDLFDSQV